MEKKSLGLQVAILFILVVRCTCVTANALCTAESSVSGGPIIVNIDEDLPAGSTVTQLKIHGDNTQIRLAMSADNEFVQFEPISRNISVVKSLDGEELIKLTITCIRIQSDVHLDLQVLIFVQDMNNHPPTFTQSKYTANVNELSPVGTTIIKNIEATDADKANDYIIYELLPGKYSEYFDIPAPAQGIVVLKKSLDYESVNKLTVTVVAKDNHGGSGDRENVQLTGTSTLEVQVQDGDDLNPRFSRDTYLASISLNAAQGTELTVTPPIKASDADVTLDVPVLYSIVSDADLEDSNFFSIDEKSGVVSLEKTPLISGTRFALLIKAAQADKPERFGTALLHVIVPGGNLSIPRFPQPRYEATIQESLPAGRPVINVAAMSGSVLRYSFEQPNEYFQIDTKTGVISTKQTVDFEVLSTTSSTAQIRLTVEVTDGTTKDTCEVIVNIENVNDNNPMFSETSYVFTMEERTSSGLVGSVKANDADRDSSLSYTIHDDTGLFSINDAGEIRISTDSAPLLEPVYKLMVTATDEGLPPRQSSVLVVVTFPSKPPVTGAINEAKSEPDYVIIIILAVLAGLLLVIIVAMVIYIAKRRSFDGKMNIPGKRPHTNPYDPKGLTYAQKMPSTDSNIYLTDDSMATSPQENPFETDSDVYTYAYPHVSSNPASDTSDYSPHPEHQEHMRHVNEIEIETAVAPMTDHHHDDDGGSSENYDSDTLPPPPQYMGVIPASTSSVTESMEDGSVHSSIPSGSTLKKQGVSFNDDMDRVNVYNPQNAITSSLLPEKPGITVYY